MWTITIVLLCALSPLFYMFYRQRKKQLELFKSLSIPGPEPHWLMGNARQLMQDRHKMFMRWSEQYGTTFGYYEGPTPVLYTANPDILKQVMVKDFSKFYARKRFPVQPEPDSELSHMFLSQGQKWKRLRTIINPTFSSSKLKQMTPLVEQKATTLQHKFLEAAETGEVCDVHKLFQCYTMDVICTVAFGVEVDSQNNPDEEFLTQCRQMFDNLEKVPFLLSLGTYIPWLGKVLFQILIRLVRLIGSPEMFLTQKLGEIITIRKQQSKEAPRVVDLLQLMLDAEVDVDDADAGGNLAMTEQNDDTVAAPVPHIPHKTTIIKHRLTVEEIKSQGFLFLIAGYETTSNALAYTSYLLATNPQHQQRVHDELDRVLQPQVPVTYDQLNQLTYLGMCINEALRIYPVASTVVDRQCMEECMVSGIPFKPGMCVLANVMDLHMDPLLWGPQDPKLFHPERFVASEVASRHPLAFLPFGAGPRNCVGLRFAMLEAKLALATVMRSCKLMQCPQTEVPLTLRLAATLSPKNGVKVKIMKR